MNTWLTLNRIMYLFGFLLLCITILLNFTTKLPFTSFIPSLFYCGLILCTYKKLAEKLSYLLPDKEIITTSVQLPLKGSFLKLSDYGLSERQIAFIIGSIRNGETYEVLANRHCVSLSVVKKDMAAACKQFGIANCEALRILLLQYKIQI